jgi:hypothetical protein
LFIYIAKGGIKVSSIGCVGVVKGFVDGECGG